MRLLVFVVFLSSITQHAAEYRGIKLNVRKNYYKEGDFRYKVFVNNDCHGAMLSERFVLTLAHCVADFVKERAQAKPLELSVIVYTSTTSILKPRGASYGVAQVILHPHYVTYGDKPMHDLALLRTKFPFDFDGSISAVPLMQQRLSSNIDVIVPVQSILGPVDQRIFQGKLYATVKSKNYQECSQYHGGCAQYILCIEHSYGDKVVFAEAGLPAQVNRSLVGIGCGPIRPNAFFSIAAYYDWIKSNIKK